MLALLATACAEKTPVEPVPSAIWPLPSHGIVYSMYNDDGRTGLHWIAADGSDHRHVTDPFWYMLSAPRGIKIAIWKGGGRDTNGQLAGEDTLAVLDMIDGKQTFIAAFPSKKINGMVLSLDGSHVAYFSGSDQALRIARSNGLDERILVGNGVAYGPIFSPDGRRIAYVDRRELPSPLRRLRVVDTESGADIIIADSIYELGSDDISWSPDGEFVACSRMTSGRYINIWKARSDGSGMQRLTPDGPQDWEPQWSPDGSMIVCASENPGEDREIVLMNADGSNRRALTDSHGIVNDSPQWSPDGSRILYRTYASSFSEMDLKVHDLASGTTRTLATGLIGSAYWDLSHR